jgi:hypothetical protein
MGTEWRAVVGFEGRYEVSPIGEVRTLLTRVAAHCGTLMRTRSNQRGYPAVTLRDASGKTHCLTVHTIVARAYLGPRPEGMEVAHYDGTRTNARLENLRYATPAENQADRIRHGTTTRGDANPSRTRPERLARGERNGSSKLTDDVVLALRADHRGGMGQKRLARKYGISPATAWEIINRRIWRHVA